MIDFIEIKDIQMPELELFSKLSEGQLLHYREPSPGIFIAESPRVIETAMDQGYEPVAFLMEDRHRQQWLRLLERCPGVPVYTASFEVLTQLTGFKLTRGMLCAMNRRPLPLVETVCSGAKRLVILENVMNPTNVGAIFRSAAALGMDGIVLTAGSSDPLYRRSIRVSMGTVFQIPWTFMTQKDWACGRGAGYFRDKGFKMVAMALRDDSVAMDDPALLAEEKLAIVLGTEGDGLAKETMVSCDYTVKIPMAHGVDSLNVAAASAVAFWELGKSNREK